MTASVQPQRGLQAAAVVVLLRDAGGPGEFYWVRRSAEASSAGGVQAFPGGRVDEADAELAHVLLGDVSAEAMARVTACRELFEETGVLLGLPAGVAAARVAEARRALLAGARSFAQVLEALGVKPDLDALQPAGRWITPPFLKRRFDARFFVSAAPPGQQAEVWPGELVSGEWTTPERALRLWERGDALLHPPAWHVIRSLGGAPWPACAQAMRQPALVDDHVPRVIEMQAGVRMLPLRTPTLPPATHTHCYALGDRELLVVDPAAHDAGEQQRLFDLCDALRADGREIREILLTHEHPDHVGAAAALRERLRVPLRAHAETAARLDGTLALDGTVAPDERFTLAGRFAGSWRAVHTPGHARGHLCFFEERSRALVAGDMLAGDGTVVIPAPPEGDMADYLASLEVLLRLDPRAIYPAHGPAIVDGPARIRAYIAHRAERERAVTAALARAGLARPEELVPAVYTDVPESQHALAAHSLRAVLDKLVKEARAQRGDDGRYALLA